MSTPVFRIDCARKYLWGVPAGGKNPVRANEHLHLRQVAQCIYDHCHKVHGHSPSLAYDMGMGIHRFSGYQQPHRTWSFRWDLGISKNQGALTCHHAHQDVLFVLSKWIVHPIEAVCLCPRIDTLVGFRIHWRNPKSNPSFLMNLSRRI